MFPHSLSGGGGGGGGAEALEPAALAQHDARPPRPTRPSEGAPTLRLPCRPSPPPGEGPCSASGPRRSAAPSTATEAAPAMSTRASAPGAKVQRTSPPPERTSSSRHSRVQCASTAPPPECT